MDTPIAYDLCMEWRDGVYWIVEYAVLENGSRVEVWKYPASQRRASIADSVLVKLASR